MRIAMWKIMLRRAEQAGYHYVATHQKGRAPSVGEQIELEVNGRAVKWTIAEIFKDHLTREGVDVFTVRAEETEGIASAAIR
jgi:hypothetical protein